MFKIPIFNKIQDFLDENQAAEASKLLTENREKYYMHPEYLFLMARYLKINKKFYQAIDCLHASLQHNNDAEFLKEKNYEKSSDSLVEQKISFIFMLSKAIKNEKLSNESEITLKNKNIKKFIEKLDFLMPGVKRKK